MEREGRGTGARPQTARYGDPTGTFNFAGEVPPDAFAIYLGVHACMGRARVRQQLGTTPAVPFVCHAGTNDYCHGGSPALDARFTAAFVSFMLNVTRVWYGTPSSPANTTFFAVGSLPRARRGVLLNQPLMCAVVQMLGPMSPTLPAAAIRAAVAQARGGHLCALRTTASDAVRHTGHCRGRHGAVCRCERLL